MHACEQFTDEALPKIFPHPLPTGALDCASFQRKKEAELTNVLEGLPQLCELAQGLFHHTCCPLVHFAVLVGIATDSTLYGLRGTNRWSSCTAVNCKAHINPFQHGPHTHRKIPNTAGPHWLLEVFSIIKKMQVRVLARHRRNHHRSHPLFILWYLRLFVKSHSHSYENSPTFKQSWREFKKAQ